MDLSRVPEPLRSKLEQQLAMLPADVRSSLEARLAKLPADQLEQVLAKTSPMLARMAGKQASSAGGRSVDTKSGASGGGSGLAATRIRAYDPNDHYNATIMRGDRPMPAGVVMLFLAVVGVVLLYAFGAFN
jgi:hypothetical protein